MQKRLFLLFVVFTVSIFHFPVRAQDALVMNFIFPGGEGSAQEAQSVLDSFFNFIQKNGGPRIRGEYFSSADIRSSLKRSDLALMSLDAFYQLKTKPEVLLSALPIETKKGAHYYVLGLAGGGSKTLGSKVILSSRLLPKEYLQKVIFKGENDRIRVEPREHILQTLKKVSKGELKADILLDSFEYHSFKKLSLKWTKNLKFLYKSRPLPPSPLVAIKKIPPATIKSLTQTLTKMNQSSEGQEILDILRIRGFAKTSTEVYHNIF